MKRGDLRYPRAASPGGYRLPFDLRLKRAQVNHSGRNLAARLHHPLSPSSNGLSGLGACGPCPEDPLRRGAGSGREQRQAASQGHRCGQAGAVLPCAHGEPGPRGRQTCVGPPHRELPGVHAPHPKVCQVAGLRRAARGLLPGSLWPRPGRLHCGTPPRAAVGPGARPRASSAIPRLGIPAAGRGADARPAPRGATSQQRIPSEDRQLQEISLGRVPLQGMRGLRTQHESE